MHVNARQYIAVTPDSIMLVNAIRECDLYGDDALLPETRDISWHPDLKIPFMRHFQR